MLESISNVAATNIVAPVAFDIVFYSAPAPGSRWNMNTNAACVPGRQTASAPWLVEPCCRLNTPHTIALGLQTAEF